MGARLQYAKVVDRKLFYAKGAKVTPGLENVVHLVDEPGIAHNFLVMRAWTDDHGTFTEQWRIEGAGGGILYESLPRELHLATDSHVEKLEDEVSELEFQYASEDYAVVLTLDGNEVARVGFAATSTAEAADRG